MKAVGGIFSILFLLFAAVQINDPDPIYWILVYLLMAGFSVLAYLDRYYPRLMLVALGGYGFAAWGLLPGVWDWLSSENPLLLLDNIAKMQYPYIEEAREFLGLVICIVALSLFYFRAQKKS
ncbi:MAG: transmembrane 220 family protein [Bacteroidota bacterium]